MDSIVLTELYADAEYQDTLDQISELEQYMFDMGCDEDPVFDKRIYDLELIRQQVPIQDVIVFGDGEFDKQSIISIDPDAVFELDDVYNYPEMLDLLE
jgi:hypothetical protein